MKEASNWRPTKYVMHRGGLRASRDRRQVNVGSRLIADCVAESYECAIKQYARGDLLDLGCGKVPLYAAYRDLVASVTCVDWPSSPHDVQHADVLCDLTEPLPLESDAYDTVIFSDVLEHLPSPQLALAEISRVLRPGGRLMMTVPFMYWLHEEPHDHFRYTEHGLRGLAERSGLRVEELDALCGGPDVFFDVASKMLGQVPKLGYPMAALLSATWGLARGFWPVKPWISRSGRRWPLEYFMMATTT